MTTAQEIESFTKYALARVQRGETEASIDELFDSWRQENPSPAVHTADLAAVKEALDEFQAGDRGRLSGELSAELRKRSGGHGA